MLLQKICVYDNCLHLDIRLGFNNDVSLEVWECNLIHRRLCRIDYEAFTDKPHNEYEFHEGYISSIFQCVCFTSPLKNL